MRVFAAAYGRGDRVVKLSPGRLPPQRARFPLIPCRSARLKGAPLLSASPYAHSHARKEWSGDDRLRPLSVHGRRQAARLIDVAGNFGRPTRVYRRARTCGACRQWSRSPASTMSQWSPARTCPRVRAQRLFALSGPGRRQRRGLYPRRRDRRDPGHPGGRRPARPGWQPTSSQRLTVGARGQDGPSPQPLFPAGAGGASLSW